MRFAGAAAAMAMLAATAGADDALRAKAKAALATLDGELRLPGLKAPVEVLRDRWGVPHIYAKNADDLFFAQGFVAAQDRLFQLDVWRRQAMGELAEAFGPEWVDADAFARLMKYRGDMAVEWASYSPDTKTIAEAFVRGINACIDLSVGERLPIEFQILGHRPKRWAAEDILGRASGIYMSQNFKNEVARLQLIQAVGLAEARKLAPVDGGRAYECHLSADEIRTFPADLLQGYESATKALGFAPAPSASNNWVVAGKRSASGKPLLASDPHRATTLPSLRYLVHLHAPGWHVVGAGEPGLPGVALGHNKWIAWGITIIGTDQADLYVEETDPADATRYKVDGAWRAMTTVKETIAVKGKAPVEVSLRYTRHGPVLHADAKNRRAYALRWSGSEPGGAAYLGGLAVSRARNPEEFRKALASWKIPGLNFVYADVEGNIGWVANALTPKRAKHDGLLPVPGDGGFEWERFLTVDELPQSWNPADGVLATANHDIRPKGYAHHIGSEYSSPYRFERIREVLASKPVWELDAFKALQQDSVSLPARELIALLKAAGSDDAHAAAADLFRAWDATSRSTPEPARSTRSGFASCRRSTSAITRKR